MTANPTPPAMSEQPTNIETVRDLIARAFAGNKLQPHEQGWLKKSEVQFLLSQAIALLPDPATQPPPQPAAEESKTDRMLRANQHSTQSELIWCLTRLCRNLEGQLATLRPSPVDAGDKIECTRCWGIVRNGDQCQKCGGAGWLYAESVPVATAGVSDGEALLDWMQANRVSIWPTNKEGESFTIFARVHKQYPIQPTAENLRAAIRAAMTAANQPGNQMEA